jgi:hypothetical protein
MSRFLALCVLAAFGCAVSGCHTVQKASTGAVEGAKQDINETYQNAKAADGWMKKNLW